jgi:hypothetical protein
MEPLKWNQPGEMPSNQIFDFIWIFHHTKEKKYLHSRNRHKFHVAVRDNRQTCANNRIGKVDVGGPHFPPLKKPQMKIWDKQIRKIKASPVQFWIQSGFQRIYHTVMHEYLSRRNVSRRDHSTTNLVYKAFMTVYNCQVSIQGSWSLFRRTIDHSMQNSRCLIE